jgi:hypothetical protein
MTRCKYRMPDGSVVIAIVPGAQRPQQVIAIDVSESDPLWPMAQKEPGTARRYVLAERAAGL